MNEQQLTATSDEQSGLDRRKFLLRTTAVTAGAWAAPSILTIDRAFGATGSPCPCRATTTDASTAKGTVNLVGQVPLTIRENACLNDDQIGTTIGLPASLGTVTLLAVSCENCAASVRVGVVNLSVFGTPIVAEALHSDASCPCEGQASGSSKVINTSVGGETVVESTTFRQITIPFGYVRLNEDPTTGAEPGEFNAIHIFYSDPLGNFVDLKLASSKVTCA